MNLNSVPLFLPLPWVPHLLSDKATPAPWNRGPSAALASPAASPPKGSQQSLDRLSPLLTLALAVSPFQLAFLLQCHFLPLKAQLQWPLLSKTRVILGSVLRKAWPSFCVTLVLLPCFLVCLPGAPRFWGCTERLSARQMSPPDPAGVCLQPPTPCQPAQDGGFVPVPWGI